MYRGFNIEIPEDLPEKFYKDGFNIYNDSKAKAKKTLDEFMLNNQSLSGTKILENWFPKIDAHIFLSHSHIDKKKAIILAGILFNKFGIKTFIDSCIWGYSANLLRNIDDNYCLNTEDESYNYTKRNYSNSHVNLMLSTALNRMIDNSECIFFLNTPNSISSNEVISRTKSPWIFSEIATTQIIRKKTPERLKPKTRMFSKGIQTNESATNLLTVEYDLELSHLANFNLNDLKKWKKLTSKKPHDALDNLYKMKPINKAFII
ncbi:hypothetical protein [uncultured Tenacibaculum sp.]|uniref:hypothetical protein n=1 Tax=uncultured Tenacibaculum sp. TaxID=174713 RepID=UPI002606A0B6|nr:hypothetical protein [uncultured Tenacibaculum sp.]